MQQITGLWTANIGHQAAKQLDKCIGLRLKESLSDYNRRFNKIKTLRIFSWINPESFLKRCFDTRHFLSWHNWNFRHQLTSSSSDNSIEETRLRLFSTKWHRWLSLLRVPTPPIDDDDEISALFCHMKGIFHFLWT